ncbi:hypothetical protein SFRURICE_015351, partial [Spodoptera frugiperda]
MSPPTKSNVWDYFEPNKEDQDKADCKICNKSYSRKGRTTSSLKNHLKSMHSEEFSTFENIMAQKVKVLIENFDNMSFTSDIWSDPSSNASLLSLTCHGIAENFERSSIILKCETFDGRHTGEIIAEKFSNMLSEWNIKKEQLHCLIRDEGSNMKRAGRLAALNDIDCTEATRELSSSCALISSVIPIIQMLEKKVDDYLTRSQEIDPIRQAVTTLKNELSTKFSSLGESNLYTIATYLDPRYKHKFFTPVTEEKIKDDILKMINTENDNFESLNTNAKRAKIIKITDCMENDTEQLGPGTSGYNKKPCLQNDLAMMLDSSSEDESQDEPENGSIEAVFKKELLAYRTKKRINDQGYGTNSLSAMSKSTLDAHTHLRQPDKVITVQQKIGTLPLFPHNNKEGMEKQKSESKVCSNHNIGGSSEHRNTTLD